MSKKFKPECQLIGQDGNIFNLIAITRRTLKEHGMTDEANEMYSRIMVKGEADSYLAALNIIGEYVEIT